jgi:hypothetical protein
MDEGGARGAAPGSFNPYAPPAAPLDVGADATFKSLTPLAQAITAVMGLLVLSEIANVAFALVSVSAMRKAIAEGKLQLHAIYQGEILIGGAEIVLWLVAVVLFCFFMPRANRNLRAFAGEQGGVRLAFKPRQAALAFFVPIVNLYRPYQAMKELWQWSDPDPAAPPSSVRVSALLSWWWGLCLLDNLFSLIKGLNRSRPPVPSAITESSWVGIAETVVSIAAAVLAALVVRAVARRHELRQQRRTQRA